MTFYQKSTQSPVRVTDLETARRLLCPPLSAANSWSADRSRGELIRNIFLHKMRIRVQRWRRVRVKAEKTSAMMAADRGVCYVLDMKSLRDVSHVNVSQRTDWTSSISGLHCRKENTLFRDKWVRRSLRSIIIIIIMTMTVLFSSKEGSELHSYGLQVSWRFVHINIRQVISLCTNIADCMC